MRIFTIQNGDGHTDTSTDWYVWIFFSRLLLKKKTEKKKFIFYGPFNFKSFVVVFFWQSEKRMFYARICVCVCMQRINWCESWQLCRRRRHRHLLSLIFFSSYFTLFHYFLLSNLTLTHTYTHTGFGHQWIGSDELVLLPFTYSILSLIVSVWYDFCVYVKFFATTKKSRQALRCWSWWYVPS